VLGAGTNEGRHKPAFSIRTLTRLTALVGQNIRQFAAGDMRREPRMRKLGAFR